MTTKSFLKIKTIGLACFWLAACQRYTGESENFSARITVTDMTGKPLKGRKVNLQISSLDFFDSLRQITATAITDSVGLAKFTYKLNIYDSSIDNAVFSTEDDTDFSGVDEYIHSIASTHYIKDTLRMDKLVPFMIRLKSDRKDIINYSAIVSVTAGGVYTSPHLRKRDFLDLIRDKIPSKLDTTLKIAVYAKQDFKIGAGATFKNEPNFVYWGSVVDIKVSRDSVFTINF